MARILIVDDEDFVRQLIREFLKGTDHVIVEAPDGRSALEEFRRRPADLVVTDNAMPTMSGAEMVRMLRTEYPSTRIVAMSGLDVEVGALRNVDRLLPKPFTKAEFLTTVTEVLSPTD